ncbi:uncharacterized protein LOC116660158 [Camelus ferus]|uniref:Uncharacterized protein LOC116660158 n=1 Tax=Camelus ferus TaxID=419612 RepID=A0A8B8S4R9_CAMFR|nr:uncharacterized protein LOC116660158 [Camelus ferus]
MTRARSHLLSRSYNSQNPRRRSPDARTLAGSANRGPGALRNGAGQAQGARRGWRRREQRRGACVRTEGTSARAAAEGDREEKHRKTGEPRTGPPLKASFLLSRARRRPRGDPGEGAARCARRRVASHPHSAATPTRRSAQRAARRRAHTSLRGGAGGGAGARSSAPALKGPPAPAHTAHARPWHGEGPESSGRARPRRPLEAWPASPWCRRGARARVSARRVFYRARGMCRTPARCIPEVACVWAGQAHAATSFWLSDPQFQGQSGEVPPKGTELRARARTSGDAGGRMPLCLLCSRAGGQPAPGATLPVYTRSSRPAFLVRGLGSPFWADNRPFSQRHL